jgi:hypothetical protein
MVKKTFLAAVLLLCTAVYALAQQALDPCQLNVKSSTSISQTASTTIFSGAASRKNYICSVAIVASGSETVALAEGTGANCATSSLALVGGAIAASGMALAANGAFALGNGSATVAAGNNANFNVCLLQVGTTSRLSGVITFVRQ